MANVYEPRECPGVGMASTWIGRSSVCSPSMVLRRLDGLDVEAGHGAEAAVGHLAGVLGAHVHGDVEVPRDGRDAAEVVEVAVRDEHRGRGEPELGERLDDDVGLVAGVDDEPLLPLHDDEAVGLERAERHGEDFDGFRHWYLEWSTFGPRAYQTAAKTVDRAARRSGGGASQPPTTR